MLQSHHVRVAPIHLTKVPPIANVMVITVPQLVILVVWTIDRMAIFRQPHYPESLVISQKLPCNPRVLNWISCTPTFKLLLATKRLDVISDWLVEAGRKQLVS